MRASSTGSHVGHRSLGGRAGSDALRVQTDLHPPDRNRVPGSPGSQRCRGTSEASPERRGKQKAKKPGTEALKARPGKTRRKGTQSGRIRSIQRGAVGLWAGRGLSKGGGRQRLERPRTGQSRNTGLGGQQGAADGADAEHRRREAEARRHRECQD